MIALRDAPVARVAMALFNRGVTRGETGDTAGALRDYDAVIGLHSRTTAP